MASHSLGEGWPDEGMTVLADWRAGAQLSVVGPKQTLHESIGGAWIEAWPIGMIGGDGNTHDVRNDCQRCADRLEGATASALAYKNHETSDA